MLKPSLECGGKEISLQQQSCSQKEFQLNHQRLHYTFNLLYNVIYSVLAKEEGVLDRNSRNSDTDVPWDFFN